MFLLRKLNFKVLTIAIQNDVYAAFGVKLVKQINRDIGHHQPSRKQCHVDETPSHI